MGLLFRIAAAVGISLVAIPVVHAQDLYDTSTLRTFELTFAQSNFVQLLRNNYASETLLAADLVVDGVSYPGVGVRIRGNTSYTGLPSGSEKFSLRIETAFTNPDQELMGYDTINLNNGMLDPTFSREVMYNNFVGEYIPNIRANNVTVTINGQNWGVYNNIQQGNKAMLRRYFANADGVRITCSNQPNGPGLAYNGATVSGYSIYEVNNFGTYADANAAITNVLIPVTNLLSNTTSANWQATDARFAIDPSIWSVVLENMLTDDDSYVNKGCDFATYTDPLDNRLHLIQRDANETFKLAWAPTFNFTASAKPVLSRVIAGVPELRQRYFAHYRTAKNQFSWAHFGPLFTANQTLLASAVAADPKKLYSVANFNAGFGTSTVTLTTASGAAGSGMAYGTIPGLQQFFTSRTTTLNAVAELVAPGPTISAVAATADTPAPGSPVYITATVAPASGGTVSKVELFYRTSYATTYQRATMLDNGSSGDGAAGDGVYGVLLPVTGVGGQVISYYVAATAGNTYSSLTFLPALAERGPRTLTYALGGTDGLRVTEFMYQGTTGEFVEFTNLSAAPIDMTGWSMDDSNETPGTFSLTPFGVVQPGESVIVTEATVEAFRTAWNLPASVKVIGQYGITGFPGNSLGRSDKINLYDAANQLVDRLWYGDQTYPGTIRTQNISGQAPCSAIGENTIAAWQLSVVGDAYGSWTSTATPVETGTPGTYLTGTCAAAVDSIFQNGFDSAIP